MQDSHLVKTNQPSTIICRVNCNSSLNLDSYDLKPDWFVRAQSDDYDYHSLIRDNSEEVVNELRFSTTVTENSRITCDVETETFAINFTSIGTHDELLVTCALRKVLENNHSNLRLYVQDLQWIVLKKCKNFTSISYFMNL